MDNNDLRSYNILRKLKIISAVNAALIFKDGGFKGIKRKIKEKNYNKKTNINNLLLNPSKNNELSFKKSVVNIVFSNKSLYNKNINLIKNTFQNFNCFILNEETSKNYQGILYEEFPNYFSDRSFIFISRKGISKEEFPYSIYVSSNSVEENINKIVNSIEYIKLLANYENKNSITAKTATFFDYKGSNYYSGGAERYLLDLHKVCKEMKINFDIYQNAEKDFFRKFRDINVIGMHNKNAELKYNDYFLQSQMKKYINLTKGKSNLHIFSAFYEIYPYKCTPSIGISHGISWDHPYNKAIDGHNFWQSKRMFIESAMNCDKMISVDTNTANWFQTIDYKLGNENINVIPNYVDTNEFFADDKYKKKDKIVITYPRRLYKPRGMYLLLEIVDEIIAKYDNVEIHFVGKGFDEDLNEINNKMKQHKNKIFCYSKTPEEMHEVYKMSDITLIPTLYSEGTSLSCLEAMATGNVVVSTRVGGLTDLVINGLNGYLIEPNSKALLSTIENIIENFDKQDKIKRSAVETAIAFNKLKWQESWKNEINSFKIQKDSKNIGLVEFYVKDASNLAQKTFDIIKKEIMKNNLVYIRSKKLLSEDNITFGLLQLVDFNEEIVSVADKLYVEKGIKVERKEKLIIIE